MKKIIIIFISIILGGAAMAQGNSAVVYFSRADENYGVGVIEKGNTEIVAEEIARQAGITKTAIFKIERVEPYPAAYRACTEEAKKEQNAAARPALKSTPDISAFDTIYLGYPNWWGDMPMCVYTFLESQDWAGKTVVPFCTHEGSGLSGTEAALKKTCRGAAVKKGLAIRGSIAQKDKSTVEKNVREWINN
ncbi:MAG: flavodoxin [Bacteroides sp.]|nr:flavodoxin [Prevotella sp.]MCM1407842.1 flavodoxin [Treponema brennaborense]MCM1469584.1 flavodoxin [Bacteroides sp.]